jgi:hypothetical protein
LAVVSGDQPIISTPSGARAEPDGSNKKTRPVRERAFAVASSTSRLVDTATTGPLADKTFGTTIEDVFPERGGPSINAPCSGGA